MGRRYYERRRTFVEIKNHDFQNLGMRQIVKWPEWTQLEDWL